MSSSLLFTRKRVFLQYESVRQYFISQFPESVHRSFALFQGRRYAHAHCSNHRRLLCFVRCSRCFGLVVHPYEIFGEAVLPNRLRRLHIVGHCPHRRTSSVCVLPGYPFRRFAGDGRSVAARCAGQLSQRGPFEHSGLYSAADISGCRTLHYCISVGIHRPQFQVAGHHHLHYALTDMFLALRLRHYNRIYERKQAEEERRRQREIEASYVDFEVVDATGNAETPEDSPSEESATSEEA